MADPQKQTFTDVQPIQQTFTDVTPIDPIDQTKSNLAPEEQDFLAKNKGYSYLPADPKFPNRPEGIYPTGLGNEWRKSPDYAQSPVDLHLGKHTYEGAKIGALAATAPMAGAYAIAHPIGAVLGLAGGVAGSMAGQAGAEKARLGETGQQISSDVGGAIGGGLGGMAGGSLENFASSTARKQAAGALLQSVAHDANKVPVDLANSQKSALELMNWQRVTNLGPTVNKFLARITDPKAGPLTYEEGRRFYQVLGDLSVNEKTTIPPAAKAQIQALYSGLRSDLGNSADQVGKAAEYYKGLGDYRKAKNLEMFYNLAQKYLTKGALVTAGGGLLGTGARFANEYFGK